MCITHGVSCREFDEKEAPLTCTANASRSSKIFPVRIWEVTTGKGPNRCMPALHTPPLLRHPRTQSDHDGVTRPLYLACKIDVCRPHVLVAVEGQCQGRVGLQWSLYQLCTHVWLALQALRVSSTVGLPNCRNMIELQDAHPHPRTHTRTHPECHTTRGRRHKKVGQTARRRARCSKVQLYGRQCIHPWLE